MLYDAYRQRILAFAARLHKGLSVARICMCVLLAVLSATAALAFCQGLFLSKIEDQSVIYGEPVVLDANAFLCSVAYETEHADGTWQAGTAFPVGVHRIRGVTENYLGIRRYTDVITVTVKERRLSLSVLERTWQYGEFLPHTIADLEAVGLRSGDAIVSAAFLADSALPGRVTVSTVMEQLRIENADGADVTDCYRIVTKDGSGIIENHLTLAAYNASKVYDGKPLTMPSCYVADGILLPGHTLRAETGGTITDVGSTENRITAFFILDEAGNDATASYTVTLQNGTLSVTPCPIAISTGNASAIYNGQMLTCETYWISGGQLPEGTQLHVEMPTFLRERGSVVNRYGAVSIVTLQHKKVIDITKNFRITDGNLGILRIY